MSFLFRRCFSTAALKKVPKLLPLRPPVVTIMGHVDHGKTTLLDYLRKSSVAAGEAGGITQHIGAFLVELSPTQSSNSTINKICFLDTPGHAAFSRIRERGANVTDIVVLVVSADDGVMAQTIESIKFAQKANVPIVVAVTKCDKFGDRRSKVLEELLRYDVVCEEYGGDTQAVGVSGLTGLNMDNLLEALLLQGELLELRSSQEGHVEGTIIEARMKQGLGECATMLVQRGTLKTGSLLVAEDSICRVRLMTDHRGSIIKEASPSTPVEVAGWKTLPPVGAVVFQVENEDEASEVMESYKKEKDQLKQKSLDKIAKDRISLHDRMWELKNKATAKDSSTPLKAQLSYEEVSGTVDKRPILHLLLKCDVIGTQEALQTVLTGIPKQKINLDVISVSVGPITETDINHAKAMNAQLIGFNVKTPRNIIRLAEKENVELHEFNIIYRIVDHVTAAMGALLPVQVSSKQVGSASVLQVFYIDNKIAVAGCNVTEGIIYRSRDKLHSNKFDKHVVRLMRQENTIWEGRIETMRHLKREINTAGKDMECGIIFEGYKDSILPGDKIICFENSIIKPSL